MTAFSGKGAEAFVIRYKPYLLVIGAVIITVLFKLLLNSWFKFDPFPFLLFFWVVVLGSWVGGLRGGGLATLLSSLVILLFFRVGNEAIYQVPYYLIGLIFFLIECLLITLVTSNLRLSRQRLSQTLATLENSNQRFTLLVRNAHGFALIFLSSEGLIKEWNEGAVRLFGYSAEATLQKPFIDFYQSQTGVSWSDKVALIKDRGWYFEETWLQKENQRSLWSQINFVALKDRRGVMQGIGVICRDLTDRKELELQKDAFLDGASHEFKTPLTSIKLLSQILVKQVSQKSPLRPSLQKIDAQVNRLIELINVLLDVTKIQNQSLKLQFSIVPLSQLTRELMDRFTPEQLQVMTHPDLTTQAIVADSKRLNSSLFQLVHYLLSDLAAKSPVTILIEPIDQAMAIKICLVAEGVSQAAWSGVEHVFDQHRQEFYSSEKGDKGVGIYFVTHILKLHDIQLSTQWSVEKGLKIDLIVPLSNI